MRFIHLAAIAMVASSSVMAAWAISPDAVNDEETTDLLSIDLKEWAVPYEQSRPRDPFATDESVWFVGQRSGYLARFDRASETFEKIDLKKGSGPHNLIVGSDGVVWYAGNRTRLIGRYDPESGEVEEISMPDDAARDPHTLVFDKAEENIWFTVQGGNMMGRLNIATRTIDLIPSKTERSRPYGVKIAPDGTPWFVLFGTHKLAKINPKTLSLTEIDLPAAASRPRRIEISSDGRIWFGDYARGMLGVYDPKKNTFNEWPLPPGEGARPYGMASDDENRIWVVATGVQPNVFYGFDPEAEAFFSATPVPSGGGVLRHMHYQSSTGEVWFGADANTIGRAVVQPSRATK